MQTERRRRPADRGRRGESGPRRAEPRENRPVAAVTSVSSSGEQVSRPKETVTTMQQEETQAGDEEEEEEEEEEERGRGRDGRRRRTRRKESESDGRGRRASSEGGEETGTKLRWRLHQLEKEKLELTSGHNRELCRLQAELTRLRSSVERGEAQGAELQYQLTLSQRDAARAVELSRDKHSLTERAAELQQTVQELQRTLDITRQAREEDQHALQQEVEERDKLIHSLSSENQQLHRLLQEQEEALEERERRMEEAREEREKEAREEREKEAREERAKEAEANRRQADELKYLMEREERSRREKEASDQRLRSLESNIEAERAAHLESKFNSELVQLRARDLEAAVAVERSGQQEAQCGLELLRAQLREAERGRSLERERRGGAERALERLQAECEQCKSDLGSALETERKTTSDLSRRLEEEKKRHGETGSRLQQTEEAHVNCVQKIRETLQQHNITGCSPPAVHDGSSSAEAVLRLLRRTLVASELRRKETQTQVQDLQQENRLLGQMTSDQSRQVEGSREESVRLGEELTRLRQQGSDWSTQSRELRAELQREREERAREVQRTTDDYDKESKVRLSFLYCLYQRLLAGCVLLAQPHSILGNFTWTELCDVIGEQVDRLTSDLREANDEIARLRLACEKKSVCVHKLQRVLSRLEESARRREEACRSECDALRGRVSSLTSDLSGGRGESASLLAACALLAGALRHAHLRLRSLCEQKRLVCRRLAEGEALEEEVRRLAGALGGEEEEEGGRRAARRWRRSVWAVLAARRWRALTKETTVLFGLERGGGGGGGGGGGVPDVCVCGDATTRADEDDEGREGVCARWLRSKRLSSTIVSSMADLQGALQHTGSAPADVTAAARSSLSRLLDHLLDQSDAASRRADDGDAVSWRLPLPPRTNAKALVSTLQQHFLLFSQRLHSAEVERRSLRLEAANLKRGLRQEREREDTCSTVPAERFHSVCAELRQALSREQEAQALIQEQTERLHALQRDPQCTLGNRTAQALSDARQEASRRKRTLRILGKHLLGVQSEKKQLEAVLRLLRRTLVASELRRKETQTQVQDLQQENRLLGQMTSDQSRQVEGSREESVRLGEELTRLRQQGSDWSTQSRELRAELQREREERAREVQRTTDDYDKESKVRLSFLYCLYQRLLAGCVLLAQPHSILGNFTWTELCDVIGEQVDRLTSDLREANDEIARLRLACEKKSVCVHKLQRVLSRLEESARRREEACRSECDALRGRVSSLTSDLSGGRGESASLLAACALLAGALRHAHLRLRSLCEQKRLVCRRLAEGEALEEEVRRLAGALGGEEEEEGGRRAARRWRRSVWAVLAARRWRALTKETTVLFGLERGGGGGGGGGGGVPDVCVCGDATTRADEDDEGREGVCARWLRSKRLSSTIVSSMADLQGALQHTGSAPADVTAAARSSLSRLLDHLLDQSDAASRRADDGDAVSWRLPLPPRTNAKALVSTLQQHFLLFSQRLHSAEVERRSLRLEAANLKRGLRQEREREDTCSTVPAERFHSVCAELRQALSREQEAQALIQEQTERLHALQRDPQCTLGNRTAQALSDARQEASRRKRTLRILGKHLLGVQSEKKQLEERLRRAEGELRDRRTDDLISGTKTSQTEVTVETPLIVPLPVEKEESKPPGPSHPNPAPSSPVFKTPTKKKKKKKKSVGLVKSVRRTTDRFSVVV